MKTRNVVCALVLAASLATGRTVPPPAETALDRYVRTPDPTYGWTLVGRLSAEGCSGWVLELRSQKWRSEAEVDRPVWKHWLTIARPDRVAQTGPPHSALAHGAAGETAILFIGGGSNRDPAPAALSQRAVEFARETGTVVAELGMVPNQPLAFSDSPGAGRFEDDLVAYSRVRQMATGDDTWLVRLAMVKSAVRAMDAVQEFLASEAGGRVTVSRFVVSGGSKRGWTTWLAAAVDRRVDAIMPTVIDALNSEAITRHHFEAYGYFSPALGDYVRHRLFPDRIGTPEYRKVLEIEDPYNYRERDRLKIPKLLVHASGDQFFLPDNSRFYFDELRGEKHLRYVPNTRHSLAGTDARESLLAFYRMFLERKPRPRFSWRNEADGSIRVEAADRPREVRLWQATNPRGRDFRVDTIGNAYTSATLAEEKPEVYRAAVPEPPRGFTAYFVELTYDTGWRYPLKLTTGVRVIPDVLPHKFPSPTPKAP